MKHLVIFSHHPLTVRGTLHSSLAVSWLSPRPDVVFGRQPWDVVFFNIHQPGFWKSLKRFFRNKTGPTVFLFNAFGAMVSWRSLAVMALNALRLKAAQVAYWHDASIIIRRLAGLEEGPVLKRLGPRIRARLALTLLANSRTYHWAASRIVKQAIMLYSGVVPERITVVYEAVDLNRYTPRDRAAPSSGRSLRVCGVGEPTYRKGVDLFVRTATRLQQRAPGAYEFVWYGASEEDIRKWDLRWADVDCLQAPMTWHGWSDNLGDLLRECDALFLSSREDPFPIAALEALACDIPVFSLDTSGTCEILPPEFVARNTTHLEDLVEAYRHNRSRYPPGFFRSLVEPHDALPFRRLTEELLQQMLRDWGPRGTADVVDADFPCAIRS